MADVAVTLDGEDIADIKQCLTSYQQIEQFVHGLYNSNINVIIPKQVIGFISRPYYIYNVIHFSIKGG